MEIGNFALVVILFLLIIIHSFSFKTFRMDVLSLGYMLPNGRIGIYNLCPFLVNNAISSAAAQLIYLIKFSSDYDMVMRVISL